MNEHVRKACIRELRKMELLLQNIAIIPDDVQLSILGSILEKINIKLSEPKKSNELIQLLQFIIERWY